MGFDPPEPWFSLLTDSAHLERLRLAISEFPEGSLAKIYKSIVNPQDKHSFLTVGSPLNTLNDQHVLEHLDRVAERYPKVIETFAKIWLQANQEALLDLAAGRAPEIPPSPAWLKVALWLWENTDQLSDPTWATVAAWLEQYHQRLVEQEAKLSELREALEHEHTQKAKLRKQLEKAEAAANFFQDEKKNLNELIRTQKTQISHLESQLQAEKKQCAQYQEEAERFTAESEEYKRLLDEREKQLAIVRSDLFECDRKLAEQHHLNRQLLEQLNHLANRLEETKREVRRLEQEAAKLKTQQGVPFSTELLGRALIIDYPALSTDPKERLIGLLELYRAFLEGRTHPLLESHTNLVVHSHQPPIGILLLGLEQLLQDGIHLPLERFLKSPTFGIETLLHRLVFNLPSPRLKAEGQE